MELKVYSFSEPVTVTSPPPTVSSGAEEIIANGARELHNTSSSSGELEEQNNVSSASNLTVIQAQHESSHETAEVHNNGQVWNILTISICSLLPSRPASMRLRQRRIQILEEL